MLTHVRPHKAWLTASVNSFLSFPCFHYFRTEFSVIECFWGDRLQCIRNYGEIRHNWVDNFGIAEAVKERALDVGDGFIVPPSLCHSSTNVIKF